MPRLLEIPSALRVQEITRPDELIALRREWNAIWERSPAATPFQSPEWLLPWWRHLGGEGLWTLAVRQAGRLVGLAPFFIHTDPATGARQVTLMGNGVTDHLDMLALPEVAVETGAAVLRWLAERRDRWECCDFRDLPIDSPLLQAPLPADITGETAVEVPCPTLRLPGSTAGLAGVIPASLLENLRTAQRRAQKIGGVRAEIAAGPDLGETFAALLALHRARWAERDGAGVLDDPRVERFHREVVQGFAARGWLRLYSLRAGSHIIAAHYGFTAKKRAYYYLGGFDPAFQRLSPGALLILHAVEDAVREGACEFDFLRGREPYKYAWGARDRAKRRRMLWRADP